MNSCCQSNVLSPVCIDRLVIFAVMLLAVRLKWRKSVVIGQSRPVSNLGRSVRLVCNVNVVDESFVWCRWWLTPVEGSLFQVSKPAFQSQSLKVFGAVG